LQAHELGNIFHVLAEDVLAAFRQHRHGLHAEAKQSLAARWIVQYVEGKKVDAFFRKKLFRSQATTSTRLGEQDELVVDIFHRRVLSRNGKAARKLSIAMAGVNQHGLYAFNHALMWG
jgi:hypothetical protein